jgi:hypothetical protein
VISVEVAADHNAFDRQHCLLNYVPNVRQQLGNSDFTFCNVLCGLGLLIAVSDQIAFQVHRINADVFVADLEPREGETSRRIDAVHRLPRFRPCGLCLIFGQDRNLLFTESALERFLERGANCDVINARCNGFTEPCTHVVIAHFLQQNDIRINRPENVCRFLDVPVLLRYRPLFCRAVRKPLEIPSRASDCLSVAVSRNQ